MEVEKILILIWAGFGGVIIILLLLNFYPFKKREKNKREEFSFKFSEEFWKNFEELVLKEARRMVLIISKKILEEFIEEQKKQLSFFYQRINERQESLEQVMRKEYLEFSNSLLKEKEFLVKDLKNKNDQIFEDLKKTISSILDSLSENVKRKLAESERAIEDYKKEKIKDLDQKIFQIISDVSKKTIGRALDLSIHEKLVIDALEKAKRERIF